MVHRAGRRGIGAVVAVLLVVNAAVVLARSGGGDGTMAVEAGVARSASASIGILDDAGPEPAPSTSAPTPVPTTSGTSRTTSAPKVPATVAAAPTPSTTTSSVVPAAGGIDGPGLYVLSPDGSGLRRLVAGTGQFSWSPDGTRLAFSSGGDLIVVRSDGSGRSVIAAGKGAVSPRWSPDGARIAFSRGDAAWVVPADGSGPAAQVGPDTTLMAWTPDSRLVAIVPEVGSLAKVVLYERDGTRRVLAADAWPTLEPMPSPDGRVVAYLGDGLRIAGLDGSGSRALRPVCCASEGGALAQRWSPDARLLAYIDGNDVRVIAPDGTGDRVLAPDAGWPAWAPDGRHVAIVDRRTNKPSGMIVGTLQLVPAGGGDRRTILDPGTELLAAMPQWSPNGRLLAVVLAGGRLPGS